MTVLCDFQTIIGDNGQDVPETSSEQLGVPFFTGGRLDSTGEVGGTGAFLIYEVTGVVTNVQVFINNDEDPIGEISSTRSTPNEWVTQIITMAGRRLRSQQANGIFVGNVNNSFAIRKLICFYHQDSD
jgi:hypothetical protein